MRKNPARALLPAALIGVLLASGCASNNDTPAATPTSGAKNVIFFLGDGMGTNMITASRIYSVGESGKLTLDTLPESAWVRTYSKNAQVTDSAPSMSAYMSGVKMDNDVIGMSADTKAVDATNKPFVAANGVDSTCVAGNGTPVTSILELAKAAGRSTGSVTTTRITHATPAATYAHICHRDGENTIAAQAVPGGAGYNTALGDGVDVLFGGGRKHFLPNTASGVRTDGRDLTAELTAKGYSYVKNKTEFNAINPATATKVVGLFTNSHMSYELDRDPTLEPSLAEMALKAVSILQKNPKGYFLMVEGGRIDHAEHETNMVRAMNETVAFDNAIKATLDKVRETDPTLANTLIVVTADHDHTLVLNGYAKRTGATTPGNAGILGLVRNVADGQPTLDADGKPYTILGFGNGENRVNDRSAAVALDEATTAARSYHQEATVRMGAGSETHGGTDVPAMAIGKGADALHGFMTNTEIFPLLRTAAGL
jgi:alkaline phosphatase